jgi:hypothetical protein
MDRIPAMTSDLTQRKLAELASRVMPPAVIVEVGVWLGACTVAMARMAATEIHAYDVFRTNADQVAKAGRAGLHLEPGQNTVPIVAAYLEERAPKVVVALHRGNIAGASWLGPRIGLYVDDACKHRSAFDAAMRTFSPWFEESAYVALLDFYFYEKRGNARALRYQREYVEARPGHFEFVERIPSSSNAIFRWHK